MNEVNNLLNKLRQTAGLPETDSPAKEANLDAGSGGNLHSVPEVQESPGLDSAPTQDMMVLEAIGEWAGPDPRRWSRVLKGLKQNWSPHGWIPDSPRDLLVAWVSASQRLTEAKSTHDRLVRVSNLTPQQRASLAARKVDISFYTRLAQSLLPRTARALESDREAVNLLSRIAQEDES